MEAHGLINATEYQKISALTQSVSSDAHKKIAGMFLLNNQLIITQYFAFLL